MQLVRLGRTDLRVSVIGQGTGQFGTRMWGYGSRFDSPDIVKIIQTDMENGVNTFDTAEMYADGLSEKLLGNALREYDREDFVIITKVAPWNLRYHDVIKAAEASISRLGLGYIDLYLIHYPNPFVPLRETLQALEYLVRKGKVKYIGASNFNPKLLQKAQDRCRHEEIAANEIEYNVLSRQAEIGTIPYCTRNGIGIIAFSPLAGGVLTGRYGPNNPPNDRAHAFNFWAKPSMIREMNSLVGAISSVGRQRDATLAQISLAWVISHRSCAAIPAALSPLEATQNAQACNIALSRQDITAISNAAPTMSPFNYALDHYIVRPIAWAKIALLGSEALTQ
jgi:myo-inositol catabolism protein IolS